MNDSLPTELLVSAQIRIAGREGVAVTVVNRGDNTSGVIILKINYLDGNATVLSQVRMDDDLVWSPVSKKDPMSEQEADLYLERQRDIDPDSWIIEIEDRQGRHWFPGRVVRG